jgi:hypothetical protein
MFLNANENRTHENLLMNMTLLTWIEAFLIDRKTRGCAKGTMQFYHFKLKLFPAFCGTQLVKIHSQLGSTMINGVNYIFCFQHQQPVCERKNCLKFHHGTNSVNCLIWKSTRMLEMTTHHNNALGIHANACEVSAICRMDPGQNQ